MGTGTGPIIPTPMKIQSALATKNDWVRAVEKFEESVFASDSLANEGGSRFNNGKISTAEKISHFAKGIGLTFTSMAKNWKGSILGAVAFGTLLTFCPTLSVPLAVLGTFSGALQIGSSIIRASVATNNKDARLAYQGMGSGLLTFLPSFFGCKTALKTANKYRIIGDKTADEATTWESLIECIKLSFGKQKSSLNVYQVAGKTAASKFKSLFIFKSKTGNGNVDKMIDDMEKKLKDKVERAKNGDGKTGTDHKDLSKQEAENDLFKKKEDQIKAKHKKDTFDATLDSQKAELENYQEQLEKLPTNEADLLEQNNKKRQELLDKKRAIFKEISKNECIYQGDKDAGKVDGVRRYNHMQQQESLQKSIESLDAELAKDPMTWDEINEIRNELEKNINTLNETIVNSEVNKLTIEKDFNAAEDAVKKAQETVDKIQGNIKNAEEYLKTFTDNVRKNSKLADILKTLGNIDNDSLVDAITDSSGWKTQVENGIKNGKPQLIFSLSDANKLRDTFRSEIEHSSSRTITKPVHDAYSYYVDWSNPDQLIERVKSMNPKTDFFSKDTPLWDGITKTIQTFATGNWLKKLCE